MLVAGKVPDSVREAHLNDPIVEIVDRRIKNAREVVADSTSTGVQAVGQVVQAGRAAG